MSVVWSVVACVAGPIMIGWLWLRGWASDGPVRVSPILAVTLWVAWGLWEQFVVQPGDNIRVDLVLFMPILLAAAIAAIIAIALEFRRRK